MKLKRFIYEVQPTLTNRDMLQISVKVQLEGQPDRVYGTVRVASRKEISDHRSLIDTIFLDCQQQIQQYILCDSEASLEVFGERLDQGCLCCGVGRSNL